MCALLDGNLGFLQPVLFSFGLIENYSVCNRIFERERLINEMDSDCKFSFVFPYTLNSSSQLYVDDIFVWCITTRRVYYLYFWNGMIKEWIDCYHLLCFFWLKIRYNYVLLTLLHHLSLLAKESFQDKCCFDGLLLFSNIHYCLM